MGTYPLIAQLLRCPVDLNLKQQKEYMIALFDQIDADGGNSIDRDEWITFFCPDRCAPNPPLTPRRSPYPPFPPDLHTEWLRHTPVPPPSLKGRKET